jgi:hypothetical protein
MLKPSYRSATCLLGFTLANAGLMVGVQKGHAGPTWHEHIEQTKTRTEQARITIAPLINVSQANLLRPHWEVQIAADPTDARRLVVCSKLLGDDKTYLRSWPDNVVIYASADGGLSWQPSFESDNHQHSTDPTCSFAADGTAYFIFFGGTPESRFRMPTYRSTDGGKTWAETGTTEALDREYITVDDTGGKFSGRLYVHGAASMPGLDGGRLTGLGLYHSSDRGSTYKCVKIADEGTQYVVGNGSGVVMSDGTFAAIFGDLHNASMPSPSDTHPTTANAELKFVSSDDGGETVGKATIVSDWYMRDPLVLNGMPSLAVDRTQGPFRDRLYAVWVDARSRRGEVRFARSDNRGKTWLPSFTVSDNSPQDAFGEAPDAFMPSIAVNRNGVIGVAWYDRRDHSDNLGYDMRFSASLDGGESFLPSLLVAPGGPSALQTKQLLLWGPWHATAESDGRTHSAFTWAWGDDGGDTAGLACDRDGVFHPVWIDRHLGIQNVWTTRVTVRGAALPNGGGGLESLRDVSAKAEVRYSLAHVDLATGEITINAAIANTSHEMLPGRLTLRLLRLASSSGAIEAQNADNHTSTGGAVWEFHSTPGQSLAPGSLTLSRQLQFRLSHKQFSPAFRRSTAFDDVIELDTKIIGK